MHDQRELISLLRRIDGAGYGAYKRLRGAWRFPRFTLYVEHVQGDPFAAPSRLRVQVPGEVAGFPSDLFRTRARRVALEDFLIRALAREIPRVTKGKRGSGRSGEFSTVDFGQCILPRTALRVSEAGVEAILSAGLPAAGRRVLGREAEARSALEALIHDAPGDPRAVALRGWYRRHTQPELARADYQSALRLDPDCAMARVGMGLFKLANGDRVGAHADIAPFQNSGWQGALDAWRALLAAGGLGPLS